jgi:hypothetical protein
MGVMFFALALPGGCRQTGRSGLIQSADLPDFIQVGEIYDFYFGNVGVVVEVLEVRSNGWVKGRVILGGEGERWWNIRQLVAVKPWIKESKRSSGVKPTPAPEPLPPLTLP